MRNVALFCPNNQLCVINDTIVPVCLWSPITLMCISF